VIVSNFARIVPEFEISIDDPSISKNEEEFLPPMIE